MNKQRVIYILENLKLERFNTLEEVKKSLTRELEKINIKKFNIDFSWKNIGEEDCNELDYSIVGNINDKNIFCDFDLYFLYDRQKSMVITEVGYEFE